MYTRGINSRTPRKNRGNVITTLSFARSCSADPRARTPPGEEEPPSSLTTRHTSSRPCTRYLSGYSVGRGIVTSGGIAAETIDSRTPFTILIAKRIVRDGGRGWEQTFRRTIRRWIN